MTMQLPTLVTQDDITKIIKYLRQKPTGSPKADIIPALGKPVLDDRRVAAYIDWGFVKMDGDQLSSTELGRSFSNLDQNEQRNEFAKILRLYDIYLKTLEYFYYQEINTILTTDLASYWVDNYAENVATKNVRRLNEQVVCFGRLVDYAGLGVITLGRGRKDSDSRLELIRNALDAFVAGDEIPAPSPETADTQPPDEAGEDSESKESGVLRRTFSKSALPPPPMQSLQINVQVQIPAEATPKQIDQIFESMAKHLYSRAAD